MSTDLIIERSSTGAAVGIGTARGNVGAERQSEAFRSRGLGAQLREGGREGFVTSWKKIKRENRAVNIFGKTKAVPGAGFRRRGTVVAVTK